MKTSARVGFTPPVWKRAQIQRLKESRLIIRGDEDRGLIFFFVPPEPRTDVSLTSVAVFEKVHFGLNTGRAKQVAEGRFLCRTSSSNLKTSATNRMYR